MAEESAKLRIPYIAAAQAQKHVTHNEAMTLLDTLVQLSVLDKDLATPPGSPSEGDCYIVAASATGAWAGWDKRIARFIDGEWRSYLPGAGSGAGWLAYVIDEAALYAFNGTNWAPAGLQLGQYIDLAEIVPPSSPGADVARLYAKDVSGETKLAFKDSAGTETVLGSGGGVSDGDKGDITVSGSGATWTIDGDTVTYAKLQNVSTTARILGRKTAGAGDPEECTLSDILDFIGSAARGDILVRGASSWARLARGSALALLKSDGTDVVWGTAGQIAFPATDNPSSDPNTLDDYEEGTWTPTLTFGGGSTGLTYSTRNGTYTKIGNRCLVSLEITLSNKGSSTGTANIGGLPFTIGLNTGAQGFLDVYASGSGVLPQFLLNAGGTVILPRLFTQSTGADAGASNTNFNNTTTIRFGVPYQV